MTSAVPAQPIASLTMRYVCRFIILCMPGYLLALRMAQRKPHNIVLSSSSSWLSPCDCIRRRTRGLRHSLEIEAWFRHERTCVKFRQGRKDGRKLRPHKSQQSLVKMAAANTGKKRKGDARACRRRGVCVPGVCWHGSGGWAGAAACPACRFR